VTTLHGRQDLPDNKAIFIEFDDMPLVSISASQRKPIPDANFVANVYHGLPTNVLQPNYNPSGQYLAFIGRMSPEKRPDRAIEIARQFGIPLKIAAKVDRADEAYFRETIAPLLNNTNVEFVGEINERDKNEFLGNALGLLFPIDWPEPFGLVMIEAMACGTPTLAFGCGSVPEIIERGSSGMIVDSVEAAVSALPHLLVMDRKKVRQAFEERFSSTRMARDYLEIYHRLLNRPVETDLFPVVNNAANPGIGSESLN
jgi:glycosyltransferase involved in cell wall biosynthesis